MKGKLTVGLVVIALIVLVGPMVLPMFGNQGQVGIALPGSQLNQCQAIGEAGCVAQVNQAPGATFNLSTGDNAEFAPPPLTSTSEQVGGMSPLLLVVLAAVLGFVGKMAWKRLRKPTTTPVTPPPAHV